MLIFLFALSAPVFAEEPEPYRPHGFLDFNTYHDTRDFQIHTLNARLDLPGPFSYFSLTNWQGSPTGDDPVFDYGDYLTEQNIFYDIADSPFKLATQYFSLTGKDNDALRFGIQSNVESLPLFSKLLNKINAWYHFTYFPWQVDSLDGYAFQLQHVYYMKIFPKLTDERLYLHGFADHNFFTGSADVHNKLVAETQFGLRLYQGLHAVTELRYNGFFPKGRRFGVGMGLQYKWIF